MNASGYTLLDMPVVIILISILAAYAVFRWPSTTTTIINSQAHRLAEDLRYTQALAMTQGVRYRVNLTNPATYQITNATGTAPALGGTVIVLTNNVTFGTFSNISNGVSFDGLGQPYNYNGSTDSLLGTSAVIPLKSGTGTCNLTITQTTGRMAVTCP